MKGRAIIPLALGLCIGVVAVKYGLDAMKQAKGKAVKTQAVATVQTMRDIRATEQITAEMVQVVETTPNRFLPEPERISDLQMVVGRVAAKAVPQGMPVLKSMLAPEGTSPGMVGRIPPGFRAASVKIDEVSGVAYQLKPGDWVDVVAVIDVDGGARTKETVAEVILQHVQVAAVGQTSEGSSGKTEGTKGTGRSAKSATLLVNETDVPKLHLAGTKGRLTLALRGDDTETNDNAPTARFSEVFRNEKLYPAEPATPALAMQPKRETEAMTAIEDDGNPHEVTITHGQTGSGNAEREELVTFESDTSRKVLQKQMLGARGGRQPTHGTTGNQGSPRNSRHQAAGDQNTPPANPNPTLPTDDENQQNQETEAE